MPFVKRSDLNRPLTSGEVDNNFTLAETLFYAGQAAGKVFENTSDGLAGTTDGQFFTVPDGSGGFSVYRNDAGVATLIGSAGYLTANDILTMIKTVDGAGSGLDADLLDGKQGSYYLHNPMTASGDIIVGGASGAESRLAKGTDGQVLTLAAGAPTWATPSAGGSGGSIFTTLLDQTANRYFDVTYTNTTGKPIEVLVTVSFSSTGIVTGNINGLAVVESPSLDADNTYSVVMIVPPGATYMVDSYSAALISWYEVS